jgi:hypothetical protein
MIKLNCSRKFQKIMCRTLTPLESTLNYTEKSNSKEEKSSSNHRDAYEATAIAKTKE